MTLPVSWRKSSHSQNASDCVEVANTLGAVRDTKNPSSMLTVDVTMLVSVVRTGKLDR